MIKIVLLFLTCLMVHIQAMEPPQKRKRSEEIQLDLFDDLPDELMVHLCSFIPEATSMQEIFSKLAQLSLINSKFNQVANDRLLLTQLARRYIDFHPKEAEEEFKKAINWLISENNSIAKDYPGALKIASALALAISRNIKNQALIQSIYHKNKDLAQLLLDSAADPNTDDEGYPVLVSACEIGNTEIVKLLLNSGAHVNAADKSGETALWGASERGHVEIVKLLLDNGADVNCHDYQGESILMMALRFSKRYDACGNESTLIGEEIVKLLLIRGADDKATESDGKTALIIASDWGLKEIVAMLLAAGADVNAASQDGYTALMEASIHGHVEIVTILINASACVNAVVSAGIEEGYTALMFASQNGHKEVVKLLLNAGADVKLVNRVGRTALEVVEMYDYTEIVDLLQNQ